MTMLPEPGVPSADPDPAVEASKPGETVGLSQGRLILRRFLGHKLALISISLFVLVAALGLSSIGFGPVPGWWSKTPNSLYPLRDGGQPTLSLIPFKMGEHPFGQDGIGRDYFAMCMRGIQNSLLVIFVIGILTTVIGSVIGALSGYYRGWVDSVLMRFTDLILVIPVLVLAAVIGKGLGAEGALLLSLFMGLVLWTGMARLVRAEFFSLREREFVDAARVAGASSLRIIFKHIYPNAIGVVIVSATLLMSAAMLLEVALSFLGLGIQAPDVSLGKLISDNQTAFNARPWLFWWPGLFIILIALSINFIGDGLRDAFDPRQSKFNPRKTKDPQKPIGDVSWANPGIGS